MRRTQADESATEIDMTPLIDCVFLLILFFLLTTQMVAQIEEVELPIALETREPPKGLADKPLVINVVPGNQEDVGEIRFSGQTMTPEELEKALAAEARFDAEAPPHGRGRGWETVDGGRASKLRVVVRADTNVYFEFVEAVMMACSKAKIYKIEVASLEP